MPRTEVELPWRKRFDPRTIKTSNGKVIVKPLCRGKGGAVEVDSTIRYAPHSTIEMMTPTKARKLAEAIHSAADFLDGGVQAMPSDAKCRCGSKKDLKMVQDRHGHNRARLGWGPPHPLCAKCRKKDAGIFRYCPTK